MPACPIRVKRPRPICRDWNNHTGLEVTRKRRLYFLLPDTVHTRAVVNDLRVFGINNDAIHTLAQPGVDLSGLPVATGRQRTDSGARLETILWDGNLAILFIALVALITMAYTGLTWFWLLLPAAIMLLTFVTGVVFTSQVPSVHLSAGTRSGTESPAA